MTEPWRLSFPMLFKGILDSVRGLRGERQIKVGGGDAILRVSREFFETDTTPTLCLAMLNAEWPQQAFRARMYNADPKYGHFEFMFVGRTMQIGMRSLAVWEKIDSSDFCVHVHVVGGDELDGRRCCVVH